MKTNLLIATALAIAFSFAPAVTAQTATACEDVEDEAAATVPLSETGEASDLHVSEEPGLYEESNGIDGLQTESGSCVDDSGDTVTYDADSSLAPEPPL